MESKYKETSIGDIEENPLLSAIKDVCWSALEIEERMSVGDDGEWDYKLKKAISPFREEIKSLSQLEIEEGVNNFYGELTLERFVSEFYDFYDLVSRMSPLGNEESKLVVAYEFLDNRITKKKERYEILQAVKKEYFWDYIHPDILKVSKERYITRHYPDAVEAAFKEVIKKVKDYVNLKTGAGLDGDRAMNRAFGFENQEPLIKFNDLQSVEEKDEQRGILNLFKGIVGIRNRKAHENITLDDPNRAMEYLALGSLLMRLFDEYKKD